MDLDDILDSLGGISRYQIIVISGCMILAFASSLTTQLAVFFSAVPSHRCYIPLVDDDDHLTNAEKRNLTMLFIPGVYLCSKPLTLILRLSTHANKILQQNSLIPAESCGRYNYNITECAEKNDYACLNKTDVEIVNCNHGYYYDKEFYKETTISEWDLVCDRAILDSVSISIYFMGFLFGSGCSGFLMDLIGRKRTMLISSVGLILVQLGCSFSFSFEMYVTFRFFTSFFGIASTLAGFTYVLEMSNKDNRTLAGTMISLMCALAHTLLAGISFLLRDWRKISLFSSFLAIPFLPIVVFLPNSPRWLVSKGRTDDALKVIKRFAKSLKRDLELEETKNSLLLEAPKSKAMRNEHTYANMFKLHHMRIVNFIIMYDWFVVSMVFYGLILNVGKLAGNPYLNATINAIIELIATPLYYWLLQKLGRRITTSPTYTLGGITCLLTMLLNHFSPGNDDLKQAARWVAISGKLFISIAFGAIYPFTADLYPTVIRGKGIGLGSMSARVGSMITPFTLHLQASIPWLTQTIFGVLGITAGLVSLILPETVSQGLLNTIEEAEDSYSKNMHFLSKKSPGKEKKKEAYEL